MRRPGGSGRRLLVLVLVAAAWPAGAVLVGGGGSKRTDCLLALDGNANTVFSQDAGDAFRSTDLRDVYGTILSRWLNMDEATILADVLPPDPGPAAAYWTAPNFDLGMLP